MIVIFHLIYSAPSIVVYNYAYFLMFPQYLCQTSEGLVHCSKEEMCERQFQMGVTEDFQYQVDWASPFSLHNWIIKLGLECSHQYAIGLFGTLEFTG